MAQVDADRNLLFGVLAMQQELIDARQFADVCAGWAVRKDVPLADLLIDRGWITPDDRREVETLLDRKVARHGGDAHATLGTVAGAEVRDAIRGVDDPELRMSLSTLPPAAGYVLVEALVKPTEQRSRYTVTRLHAEGGLGMVWLARDNDLNREVALKEIRPEQTGHPEAWRRFLKEAQITGQLEHPNIVPVYELARRPHDDQPFYTMRFVRGRTLRQVIAEHHKEQRAAGHLDPVGGLRLLQAFVGVCQAIGYAHARGVVHRDLKPENVVLGGFGEVVVLDWGLAKMVDRPDEEGAPTPTLAVTDDAGTEATQAGTRLGTPAYMAPEQAEGRLDLVDNRTDIYGLGAILFEILTGRPPHQGGTLSELLDRIVAGETPRARTVEPAVPPALEAICARAMAKVRVERYAKAADLAEDVQRWLADEPTSAYREGWGALLARWARRHRAWTQAGAAAALVVTVVSVAAALLVNRARRAEELHRIAAEERKQEALTLEADLAVDRGQALCEQGNVGLGLLWLSRGLQDTPDAAADLRRTSRRNLSAWRRQYSPQVAAFPHQGPISTVAFRPDGKAILTGSQDGTARLWDAATGQALGPPMTHRGPVLAMAIGADGRLVVTGGADGTARLWDAATSQPVGKPMAHQGPVAVVAFRGDGKAVLTASADRTARLWDVGTGQPLTPPMEHAGPIHAAAIRPDGRAVLTGSEDGTARLWDASSGKPIGPPLRHEEAVSAVAFRPDSTMALTGSKDKTARRWDAATGQPIGPPMEEPSEVGLAMFSPDGRVILTAGTPFVQLRDAATGAPGPMIIHPSRVQAAAFHPDGRTLLTGVSDNTARLWDTVTGQPVAPPLPHKHPVYAVAFGPDGKTLATGCGDGTARLWDAPPGQGAGPAIAHPLSMVFAAAYRPDGKAVFTGSGDVAPNRGEGRLYNPASGRPMGPPLPHPNWVLAVAISPDGRTLLTGCADGMARRWAADGGRPIDPALPHGGAFVYAAAYRPDGSTIATGCGDGTARLWDAATGKPVGRSLPHPDAVKAVAFRFDGRMLLTGCDDKSARLWDLATGMPVGPPMPHQGAVNAVAFRGDGKLLLTGGADSTARLWDAATGQPVGPPLAHQGPVNAVAFSPDGTMALTGSKDQTARLWDVATGKPIGPPLPHTSWVNAVTFAPDGKLFLAGTRKAVLAWRVPAPAVGEVGRIALWTQVLTRAELGRTGKVLELDDSTWRVRRRRLEALGGPPAP